MHQDKTRYCVFDPQNNGNQRALSSLGCLKSAVGLLVGFVQVERLLPSFVRSFVLLLVLVLSSTSRGCLEQCPVDFAAFLSTRSFCVFLFCFVLVLVLFALVLLSRVVGTPVSTPARHTELGTEFLPFFRGVKKNSANHSKQQQQNQMGRTDEQPESDRHQHPPPRALLWAKDPTNDCAVEASFCAPEER